MSYTEALLGQQSSNLDSLGLFIAVLPTPSIIISSPSPESTGLSIMLMVLFGKVLDLH
jgi:hypothetical protein